MHDLEGLFCKTVNHWIIEKIAEPKKIASKSNMDRKPNRGKKAGGCSPGHLGRLEAEDEAHAWSRRA